MGGNRIVFQLPGGLVGGPQQQVGRGTPGSSSGRRQRRWRQRRHLSPAPQGPAPPGPPSCESPRTEACCGQWDSAPGLPPRCPFEVICVRPANSPWPPGTREHAQMGRWRRCGLLRSKGDWFNLEGALGAELSQRTPSIPTYRLLFDPSRSVRGCLHAIGPSQQLQPHQLSGAAPQHAQRPRNLSLRRSRWQDRPLPQPQCRQPAARSRRRLGPPTVWVDRGWPSPQTSGGLRRMRPT